MRNLTLKKVALGVFLAGFAASSAYAAALSATSSKTIVGTAPTIKSPTAPGAAGVTNYNWKVMRSVSGTLTDIDTLPAAQQTIQVGDVIHIIMDYADADGDLADALTTTTKLDASGNSVQFVIFNHNGTTAGADQSPTVVTAADIGTPGDYTYTVLNADVGKTIGISLTPVSKFGDPVLGTPVKANNLFTSGVGTITPPPIVIPNPTTTFAYIFENTAANIASNVAGVVTPTAGAVPLADTVAGATPKLGGKYIVTVYDGASPTAAYATANAVLSTSSANTIEWYVNSGNAAAGGAIAAGTNYIVQSKAGSAANANEFTIPTLNSGVTTLPGTTVPTTVEAGIQGFRLNVDVNY